MALSTEEQRSAAAGTGAAAAVEEYAASELPASERHSTLSITLVRMGYTVSATDLLFGMSLGLYFSFWTALYVALLSSIAICAVSILVGLIGQREGLTTALITRMAFGREGSRIPSLVIAAISVGFVGYSTAITADVLPGKDHAYWLIYIIVLSIIYTVLSSVGFAKGLTWVGRISVPLMIIAVLVAVVAAINHAGGWSQIINGKPAQPDKLSIVTMIALGTAKWMQGATVSPDITRFARNAGAVYTTTIAEFLVGNLGFNLLGIILGLAVGTGNMGEAFTTIGVGALATIAIFVQGFPHEVNNLYAGSLAGRNALDVPRLYVNIASGVLAAALAYYGLTQGLLQSFLRYLGYLAYAMPLIPGIMIADYFLICRGRYTHQVSAAEAVNWRAVAAFVIGLAVNLYLGLVANDALWHTLPVIGFVLYLVFSWRQLMAAWSKPAV
ncbi:MAG: purine-cytosine permease family protein [Pseudolabrys sp.]